jgi:hypothetical protein
MTDTPPPAPAGSGSQPSSTTPSRPSGLIEKDLTKEEPEVSERVEKGELPKTEKPTVDTYDLTQAQEGTRGDLARGLLWLLTLTVGSVVLFVGLGRLEGALLVQSIFPSLVTLAGTALGFYFGSQSGRSGSSGASGSQPPANS